MTIAEDSMGATWQISQEDSNVFSKHRFSEEKTFANRYIQSRRSTVSRRVGVAKSMGGYVVVRNCVEARPDD